MYEVSVHESTISWLFSYSSELDLQYDPTKPLDHDVRIYGIWEATKRVESRFLERAAEVIRSGCTGVRLCYRMYVRSRSLYIPLEWAILKHDLRVLVIALSTGILLTISSNLMLRYSKNLLKALFFSA